MNYQIIAINDGVEVYAQIDDDGVSRLSCSAEYPPFQEWLAEGNTPLPYVAPPPPAPLTTEQKIAAAGFDEGELEDFLVAKIQLRLNE